MTKPATDDGTSVARMATMKIARLSGFFSARSVLLGACLPTRPVCLLECSGEHVSLP